MLISLTKPARPMWLTAEIATALLMFFDWLPFQLLSFSFPFTHKPHSMGSIIQ